MAAIKEQAAELIHFSASDFYLPIYAEVCRASPRSRRSTARPGPTSATPGTEVVEASIKLARYATKRPYIVAFLGAFHGRTLRLRLADRVEGEVPRRLRAAAAGRLPRAVRPGRGPDVVRRRPVRQARPGQRGRGDHRRADPGRGRLHRPRGRLPPGPARHLRPTTASCSSPTRSSRAPAGPGKMWAIEHWGVEPDILLTAKGIASGMPLGAMVARADLLETWGPGAPRLDVRRQPGRLRRGAGHDRPARGRAHRQRRRARRAGPGRPAAAGRPVRRPRHRRPRQGPDARRRVRHRRARRGGPVGLLRARPAGARVRQVERPACRRP